MKKMVVYKRGKQNKRKIRERTNEKKRIKSHKNENLVYLAIWR